MCIRDRIGTPPARISQAEDAGNGQPVGCEISRTARLGVFIEGPRSCAALSYSTSPVFLHMSFNRKTPLRLLTAITLVFLAVPTLGAQVLKPGLQPGLARAPDSCLLYTSDAADDLTRVDLGGRRLI